MKSRRRVLTLAGAALLAAGIPVRTQVSAQESGSAGTAGEPRFWLLVDATIRLASDPRRQEAALHDELAALSVHDIEAFEQAFQQQMWRSYSWDLWGAAYVVHGGASDDEFEYFRCWLISQGRHAFEQVLADPDSLADILPPDIHGVLAFESFAHVARRTWGEKTGKQGSEMPNAASLTDAGQQPAGVPFQEDPLALARRYPKLWKRFGKAALQ